MAKLGSRKYYDQRFTSLDNERSSYLSHWRELSDYIMPRRGRFLITDNNKGSKKNSKIIDNSATLALRTLASGMMAGLTSPARPWFRLGTPDPKLSEVSAVKEWIFEVQRRMQFVMQRSNLYNSLHTVYQELGLFGTGCLVIQERLDTVFWVKNMTAGQYWISTNQYGSTDAMYRELRMTAAMMVTQFGLENCSDNIQTEYKQGNLDAWHTVRQVIEPNRKGVDGGGLADNKPFASVYYEKNASGAASDKFLRESGFDEFPVMGPRWDVNQGDIYGRSPGMDILGDVKQLQLEQKRKAQGIDKLVDPPMVGPPELRKGASTLPGALNVVNTLDGSKAFIPAYQVRPLIGEMVADIQDVRTRISRGMYEDLFLMLSQSTRREITAREVEERHEEKLLMLGPVLERLQNELLDPLIDRIFGIMLRGNLLPPPPQELAGVDLKVEYISILAQAQRSVAMGGINAFVGFVANVDAIKPGSADKFDGDQAIDEAAESMGIPPQLVLSDNVVAKERKARADAAAQAQRVANAAQMVDSAKTMSETDTAGKNGLTDFASTAAST